MNWSQKMLNENTITDEDFNKFLNDVEDYGFYGNEPQKVENLIKNNPTEAQTLDVPKQLENPNNDGVKNEAVDEAIVETMPIDDLFNLSGDDFLKAVYNDVKNYDKKTILEGDEKTDDEIAAEIENDVEADGDLDREMDNFINSIESQNQNDYEAFLADLPENIRFDVINKVKAEMEKTNEILHKNGFGGYTNEADFFKENLIKNKEKLIKKSDLKKFSSTKQAVGFGATPYDLDSYADKYGADWVIGALLKNGQQYGKIRRKETAANILRNVYRARRQKLPWRSENPYTKILKSPNAKILPEKMKNEIAQKEATWKESVKISNIIKQILNGDFNLPNTESYKRINTDNINHEYLKGEIPDDPKLNDEINSLKKYNEQVENPEEFLPKEQKLWLDYKLSGAMEDFDTWSQNMTEGEKLRKSLEDEEEVFRSKAAERVKKWDDYKDSVQLTPEEAEKALDEALSLFKSKEMPAEDNFDIESTESSDLYKIDNTQNHYEVPDVINYDPENFYEMVLAAEPGELEEIRSRVPVLFDPNDSNVIDVAYRIVDDEEIPEDDPKKRKARALLKLSGVGYDDGNTLGFNKPEFHTNLIRGMDYNPAGVDNSEKAITNGPSGTKTNVSGAHGGVSVPNVSVPTKSGKPTTSAGRLAGGGITYNNPAKTNDAITAGSNGGGLTTTTDKQINTVWEKSGGTLHENLNKLPGGFANNQAFKTGLAPKGQTMTHKGDLIGGGLQQMLENDMKNWPSTENSGDRYKPLTVIYTGGRFTIQQGRKRTLIENADEKTKQMLIEKIQQPNV